MANLRCSELFIDIVYYSESLKEVLRKYLKTRFPIYTAVMQVPVATDDYYEYYIIIFGLRRLKFPCSNGMNTDKESGTGFAPLTMTVTVTCQWY